MDVSSDTPQTTQVEAHAQPPANGADGRPTLAQAAPFLLVAAMVYAIDQATKAAVVAFIELGESVPAEGAFRLTHITNTGSALGLLKGPMLLFILASFVGIFGVLFYFRTNGRHSALLRLALGLVLGGALGNLTDRLLRGAVVDFIDVELWPGFRWWTFNIADSALMTGLALLAFYVLRERERPEGKGEEDLAEDAFSDPPSSSAAHDSPDASC
jgi:signal peptidase II